MAEVGLRYLEHLTERDLALLAPVAGVTPADSAAHFRSRPQLVEPALNDPRLYERLFVPADEVESFIPASPFLLFAVVVQRAVAGLRESSFVEERVSGARLPVFDTATLADFAADPGRRIFVAEHLSSYTRVANGPVWVRRGDRMRRHRFSEIDPGQLAATLPVVTEAERPGIYRRLGDLALFLTGVFPDHTAGAPVRPIDLERVLHSVPYEGERPDMDTLASLAGDRGWTGLLEWLGPRWYRQAAARTPLPTVSSELEDVAERFAPARRFLNVMTDRYLYPARGRWFPGTDG